MLKICSFGAMTGVCKLGFPRFKFLVNLANFNYASFFRQENIRISKAISISHVQLELCKNWNRRVAANLFKDLLMH